MLQSGKLTFRGYRHFKGGRKDLRNLTETVKNDIKALI